MSESPFPDLPPEHFDQLVGLEYTEFSKDGVTGTLKVTPQLHQPYGIVHGGVLCSVVESVASASAALWFEGPVVGTSNHTNFIKAARSGTLTARSTPIHRGRSQQLWEVDITDEQGRLIAKGQVRLANLDNTDLGKG
jgi:uncharacterized protein (TIGR00369 family)